MHRLPSFVICGMLIDSKEKKENINKLIIHYEKII